mgnify:CR=1 FL=1
MNLGMEKNKTSPYLPFMAVYIAAAVLFMVIKIFAPEFTRSFTIKVIPALSLALAILFTRSINISQRMAMLAGALFCGAGDVILDINRVRFFVPGLAAFLLGHVGFLALFWMRRVSATVQLPETLFHKVEKPGKSINWRYLLWNNLLPCNVLHRPGE